MELPPYAFTVVLPLVSVTADMGPTEIKGRSHTFSEVRVRVRVKVRVRVRIRVRIRVRVRVWRSEGQATPPQRGSFKTPP